LSAKSRRIPKEFLGAFKRGHRHAAREFIDEDLAEELLKKTIEGDSEAKKALQWLTRFNNELYKDVFENSDQDLNQGTELRKEIRHDYYARRMDVMAKRTLEIDKSQGVLTEDQVIAVIDFKREKEKSRSQ